MNAFLIKWAIILAVGGGLIYGAYAWAYNRGEAAGRAEIQAKFDEHLAADKKAAAEAKAAREAAEKAARDAEEAHRKAIDEIVIKYEKEKEDAKRDADALAAELRDGTTRLRREWRGCQSRLSAAGSAPAEPDGDTILREQGTVDIIGIGRAADNQIRGLQTALMQCHALRATP